MSDWTVIGNWRYEAVEVIGETDCFIIVPDARRPKGRRIQNQATTHWRGSEAEALKLAERLTSARAESDRRKRAATDWFVAERKRLTGETA